MNNESNVRDVFVSVLPISLMQLLKLESLVSSGGEARMVIDDELVKLNGEIETRKRKKIVAGDVVSFGQESIRIHLEN